MLQAEEVRSLGRRVLKKGAQPSSGTGAGDEALQSTRRSLGREEQESVGGGKREIEMPDQREGVLEVTESRR